MRPSKLANFLTAALLSVVGLRVMLFGIFGVSGVRSWSDFGLAEVAEALIWAATGLLMTGGQMYLLYTRTSLRARDDVEWGAEGRAIHALILAVWALLASGAVLMGGAHVAMQISGRPLFGPSATGHAGVLEMEFIRAEYPVWIAALLSQMWIEALAAALGMARATQQALGIPHEVRTATQRAEMLAARVEELLHERNLKSDEAQDLKRQLDGLEGRYQALVESAFSTSARPGPKQRTLEKRPDPDQKRKDPGLNRRPDHLPTSGHSGSVQIVTCPATGCNWSAAKPPGRSARMSLVMHWSKKHGDLPRPEELTR